MDKALAAVGTTDFGWLGGGAEFDGGGVAEGVEDAEHEVGGDGSWELETGKWKLLG
jgi:hypothetical protein